MPQQYIMCIKEWLGKRLLELFGHLINRDTVESIYAHFTIEPEVGKGLVITSLNYADSTPVYGASS